MNITIATGCPGGGWDEVFPFLRQAGFEPPDENLARWYDELALPADAGDPAKPRQPLQPGPDQAERARSLLAAAHAPKLLADNRSLPLLEFWAMHFPQAGFLLLYTLPEAELSRMLLRGDDPSQFLESWQAASRQMLQFHRRHRQRALLLDAAVPVYRPQAFVEACRYLNIRMQPYDSSAPDMGGSALTRLIAEHLVSSRPELQFLKAELEASALPLRNGEAAIPRPQPERVAGEFLQFQAREQGLQQRLDEAVRQQQAKELEQQQQIDEATRQLEAARQELQQQSADNLQLRTQLEESGQSRATLEAAHRDAMHEGELLLLQVHQLQEELEACSSQSLAATRQLEARNEELNAIRQRMAATAQKPPSQIGMLMRRLGALFSRADGERAKLLQLARLIENSGLFDKDWYVAENADVRREGVDPVRHYLMHGAAEGRNPSATFNTRYYLETNPDVAATGMNPLIHYIKFGKTEGRQTSPFRNAA